MPPAKSSIVDAKAFEGRKGISKRGYWVFKEEIGAKTESELKKELTMVPKTTSSMPTPMGASPVSFEVWRESATKLYLPKYFGLSRFGVPPADQVAVDPGVPLGDGVKFACALRDEQKVPVKAFLDAARDPSKMGGILSLPCGFGKVTFSIQPTTWAAAKALPKYSAFSKLLNVFLSSRRP
jgi:hypothetical protein